MSFASYSTVSEWEETLPRSEMVYPSQIFDRIKYRFWRMYTPFHPIVRDFALSLGVVSHSGRQDYLIGKVVIGKPLEDLVHFLISKGYGNHFIAWRDDGELLSLRYSVDFKYQYHIRIFEDGEIRAHFEYTPECYPLFHLWAVNQKDCRREFHKLLKGKIVPIYH